MTTGTCYEGPTMDNNNTDLGLEQKPLPMASVAEFQAILKPFTAYYNGVPFRSCLRSPQFWEESPDFTLRYTPCPMLNPLRKGTGLFSALEHDSWCCNTAGTPQPIRHVKDAIDHNQDQDSSDPLAVLIPQINLGEEFQASLPELQDCLLAQADPAWAQLAWKPSEELQEDPGTQSKVENLLNMACSSVFPGGGTNQEFALHCLFEANGDTLAALELLLLKTPRRPQSHPLADYHYTGSDVWLPQEHHLFNKAFSTYKKDFYKIQQMVRTKNLRQCVEYYYLYKKGLKSDKKYNGWYKERLNQDKTLLYSQPSDPRLEERLGTACATPASRSFPCKQCGKVFYKIKSRNAHMKIHRPHEIIVPPAPSLPPILFSSYTLEPALEKPPTAMHSTWSSREEESQQYDPIADALSCPGLAPLYIDYSKDKYLCKL
nr:zinc finger protein 541-like isoform X2 [Geotrypetes seraphini]